MLECEFEWDEGSLLHTRGYKTSAAQCLIDGEHKIGAQTRLKRLSTCSRLSVSPPARSVSRSRTCRQENTATFVLAPLPWPSPERFYGLGIHGSTGQTRVRRSLRQRTSAARLTRYTWTENTLTTTEEQGVQSLTTDASAGHWSSVTCQVLSGLYRSIS
jgi:hypothetical protein